MTAPTRPGPAVTGSTATARRTVVAVAALWAGLAVAVGAFGAHGLEGRITDARLATFETGVRYHMWHALGALALTALGAPRWAAWLLLAGSAVFAGSLYLLVLTDTSLLGAVAPIGGALMIAGWGLAGWRLLRG